MKNTNKGFTLVELIVVITILAILGTIAFISLQGYSQDAKNAKVGQDLNTLASAIEIGLTDGKLSGLTNLVDSTTAGDAATYATDNDVASTGTITLFDKNNNATQTALSTVAYNVGIVDFAVLRQNGDDFKDPEDKNYIAAVAYSGATAYYQLVGQKKENSGTYTALVKGNYIAQSGDTAGLVADKTTSTAVTNNRDLGTDGLYN